MSNASNQPEGLISKSDGMPLHGASELNIMQSKLDSFRLPHRVADQHLAPVPARGVIGNTPDGPHSATGNEQTESKPPTTLSKDSGAHLHDAVQRIDEKSVHNPKTFVSALTGDNFSKIDTGDKKYLTRDDLSAFVNNGANSQPTRAAAYELLQHYNDVTHLLHDSFENDGLTLSEQIARKILFTEDKYMAHGGISEKAIKAIGKMYDTNLQSKFQTGTRIAQVAEDTIYTAADTYFAIAGTMAAIAGPEPFRKVGLGAGMLAIAAVGLSTGRDMFANPASVTLRKEFESRQKMLESWKFFEK